MGKVTNAIKVTSRNNAESYLIKTTQGDEKMERYQVRVFGVEVDRKAIYKVAISCFIAGFATAVAVGAWLGMF